MNKRGGALIATIIISMLLLSVTVWYFNWSWTQSQESTHAQASQRALEYAESGIQSAEEQLMMPSAGQDLHLEKGSGMMERGRYEFEFLQDTQTPAQVEVHSTGYCEFPHGNETDPLTQKRSQRAVVHTVFYIDRMDRMMIAVPGKLMVNPGTIAGGAIYAADLVFVRGPDNNPARIGAAVYSHSISRDDGVMDPAPSYVVFMSSPTRLGYPLRIPQLSSTVRNYYQALATSRASQLDDGASLDGTVDVPTGSDVPVYFCNGDLHVSKVSPFIPKGPFVVYVTGLLHVHNSVVAQGGWAVFLAEKGIQIEDEAPTDLVLQATFVTNGTIAASPRHRAGKLLVNGSLVAGQGIDLAAGWDGQRTYLQHPSTESLPLPHLVERLQSEVVQGKFQ